MKPVIFYYCCSIQATHWHQVALLLLENIVKLHVASVTWACWGFLFMKHRVLFRGPPSFWVLPLGSALNLFADLECWNTGRRQRDTTICEDIIFLPYILVNFWKNSTLYPSEIFLEWQKSRPYIPSNNFSLGLVSFYYFIVLKKRNYYR